MQLTIYVDTSSFLHVVFFLCRFFLVSHNFLLKLFTLFTENPPTHTTRIYLPQSSVYCLCEKWECLNSRQRRTITIHLASKKKIVLSAHVGILNILCVGYRDFFLYFVLCLEYSDFDVFKTWGRSLLPCRIFGVEVNLLKKCKLQNRFPGY